MFLFTHIEKCAGTSFNELLSYNYLRYFHITKNNYGGNEFRNDLNLVQYKKLLKYHPTGIGGHSVRPYLNFFDKKAIRITFFRNPVERYISHMNHTIERGWAKSIDDFFEKEQFKDFMTKKIAGLNELKTASDILSSFNFIGNVNEYNKSLNYLEDILQKKFIGRNNYKNQRKFNKGYVKYSDLTNKQIIKVEENNRNDIKYMIILLLMMQLLIHTMMTLS